ncbi:MAG TPA: M3 family oligoendopeptidase [Herpetosiphonaceae bacterium]
MSSSAQTLPHWDMTVVYPSLKSPEFAEGVQSLTQSITDLEQLFDTYHIAKREATPLDAATVQAFEAAIEGYNAVLTDHRLIHAYISSFVTTDSRDDEAQARLSELQQEAVRITQLDTRLTAWIGNLDVEALIRQSEVAQDHAFALRQFKQQAEHLMSPAEEALATELSLSGSTAWSKLHSNVTSQLMVPFEQDGQVSDLPMSVIRNLAFEDERDVRRRAYEAEIASWERAALPLAAALNSIKAEVNTLSRRRGWNSPLDQALFDNNIDRQTLDAMMEAARESFPDFRRYLRTKARAIGVEQLPWYDLFAPVGTSDKVWEFDTARDFIIEQFGTYSDKMRDFAIRAFSENWVDAEPRPGKRDGAYCMGLRKDESRVFANFKPAFGGMSTLAHELGHAYHNLNLAERTMLQRATPMVLAETASIFCETIVRRAALQQSDLQEQISILEATLQSACQVVVDISSRFLFEQRVFETRQQRELSVDDFCRLMLDAQRETYGDGLDQDVLHPYMWAVKGHYYSGNRSFYNYPYMFGMLFGLGLYARYQEDAEAFKRGYDDLLSSTGLADAATLAERFGIDIRTPDFWRSSLDIVRDDIRRFEQVIEPRLGWGAPQESASDAS